MAVVGRKKGALVDEVIAGMLIKGSLSSIASTATNMRPPQYLPTFHLVEAYRDEIVAVGKTACIAVAIVPYPSYGIEPETWPVRRGFI